MRSSSTPRSRASGSASLRSERLIESIEGRAALVDTVERGDSFSLRILRRGDAPASAVVSALADPESFFAARAKKRSAKKERRRDRRKRLVGWKEIDYDGARTRVFLKLFRVRTTKDCLEEWLFGKRAVRALRAGIEAESRGISVPRHLAAAHRECGWFARRAPGESMLLMLALPTRKDAREALTHDFAKPGRSRRAFLRAVGEFCGELHRRGLAHGDLKAGNLIVLRRDRPEFALLDLDRTSFRRPDRPRLDLKDAIDLYRLLQSLRRDTTPRERRRLLAAYRRARGFSRLGRCSLAFAIVSRHLR